MTLTISLLGPLQLTYQNELISNFDTAKAKALLAYLALSPDQKYKRTSLAALFWPEQSESVARNNLRQTLYRLNKQLPISPLIITRNSLRLDAEACWVDVQLFQNLWQTCQKHAHPALDQCPACAHRLEELVALYRAPFLDDLLLADCAEYEQWLVQQQEWFHEKTQRAYQALVTYYASRQIDTALAYARRWVTLDPYNEEAQRALMRLLGEKGQRGLALVQYEELRQLLAEELNITPTAETTAVYELVKQGHASPQTPPAPFQSQPTYQLTTPPTELIGREAELACLAQWLAAPACRLITLAGLPGSGASALAVESARAQAGQFAHGVLQLSLRDVTDALGFWQTLATALGVPQYTPDQMEQSITAVLAQQQLLLLLDDWHTPHASLKNSLVRLLHYAPSLKVIATTHERLQLTAEWLLILTGLPAPAPLPSPQDEQTLAACPAVRLFLTHIQRVRGGFTPTPADWPAMGEICRQLGGNPRAIIALAKTARLLSLPDLRQNLQENALQTVGLEAFGQQMGERWAALSPTLRERCAALAVFAPDSTTAALQAVCDLQLGDVAQLVESALLTQQDGVAHFDPLWQRFVRTQRPPTLATRQAHATYYETFLAGQVTGLRQQNQRTAVFALRQAQENIVQAWQVLAANHGRVRPSAAWGLFHFYDIIGQLAEARMLLALPNSTPLLQAMQGWFAFQAGQTGMAHQMLLGKGELLRQQKETKNDKKAQQAEALVRCYTAVVLNQLGDLDGAEQELRQAWLLSQQLGDLWGNAFALNIAGDIAFARTDLTKAAELYQQSLTLKRIVQDDWGQAFCLMNLGQVAFAQHKYDEAAYFYQQGVELRQFVGDERRMAASLAQLGHVARQQGDLATAQARYRTSYDIYEQFGVVSSQIQALLWVARVQHEGEAYLEALQTYQQGLALAVGEQQVQQVVEILLMVHHLQVEMAHLGRKVGGMGGGNTAVSTTRDELLMQNLLAQFNLLRQRHEQSGQLRMELQQFVHQLFPVVPPNLSLRL